MDTHEPTLSEPVISISTDGAFMLALQQIKLHYFRSYTAFMLDVEPAPVILTGPNGAGKTNILEAISLLAPGRGLRHARIAALDNQAGDGTTTPWAIAAQVSTPGGVLAIGTGRDVTAESDKRMVKIDGEVVRGHTALAAHISLCVLTPQMDQTFNDGHSSRRQYLDRLTGMFAPEHSRHLAVYDHAKSERRQLLLRGNADVTWLDSLEQRMAEHAMAIAAARLETTEHVQHAMAAGESAFPKAELRVAGVTEELLQAHSALEAEHKLREALAATRAEDAASGRTQIGPHRSDFVVQYAAKQMLAEQCSTGEQKALLLAITLASARAKAGWSGVVPMVLLDEVVAHLDAARRVALFAELHALGTQCWLTGTDTALFSDFPEPFQAVEV